MPVTVNYVMRPTAMLEIRLPEGVMNAFRENLLRIMFAIIV